MASVLLVDGDQNTVLTYRTVLERGGHRVSVASTFEDAIRLFDTEGADAIVANMDTPGKSSMEFVKLIRQQSPATGIIVMTGVGNERNGIQAMKSGADVFVRKSDIQSEELILLVEKAIEKSKLQTEITLRTRLASMPDGFNDIIGEDSHLLEVLKVARKVAPTDLTILITGESGTGKKLLAQVLHASSSRRSGPFVPIHCAALPKASLESELFGHLKGAFAGAETHKKGFFEEASGGTIFLDEIAELESTVQFKLLRFLQEHTIVRIGDSNPIPLDIRVICASSKDLKMLIGEKKFREDLYYCINAITLALPPLRDRRGDIPALSQNFVERYGGQFGRFTLRFSREAIERLTTYDWPGNIRELQNVIERSVLRSDSDEVGTSHLPKEVMESGSTVAELSGDSPTLQELERRYILGTLRDCRGNKGLICERLGISTTTLWRKLKVYGESEKRLNPG